MGGGLKLPRSPTASMVTGNRLPAGQYQNETMEQSQSVPSKGVSSRLPKGISVSFSHRNAHLLRSDISMADRWRYYTGLPLGWPST